METNLAGAFASVDALSTLVRELQRAPDGGSSLALKKAIVLQAKQLITNVQDPFDYLMDQIVTSYVIGATLALLKLGVFDTVPATGSITLVQLAQDCNTSESLIARLMRQLTCINIFSEVREREWAHNKLSIILSKHVGSFGHKFYTVAFDEMLPPMLGFHKYLELFDNQESISYVHNPHAFHNNMIGRSFWQILDSDPKRVQTFNSCVQSWSDLHPVVDIFPFSEALKHGNDASRPLLVDIGGGLGQAIQQFRAGCPELKGHVVLQDRPEVISSIKEDELPGVTKMAHDFFTEQPVKNAQVYYIRRVMHDWLDPEAANILKQIIPSMGPDSRILVADMVIPAHPKMEDAHAVWLDLMMMTIHGKERTHSDWTRLAELSGLKLVKLWQEPENYGPLCVVEYMLPETSRVPHGNHLGAQSTVSMGLDGACDFDMDYKYSSLPLIDLVSPPAPETPQIRNSGSGDITVSALPPPPSFGPNSVASRDLKDSASNQEIEEMKTEPMSPRRTVEVGG